MQVQKDYYATLGVSQSAQLVVIRAAYRALAQLYHPDRYSGPQERAHIMMAELNEAYSILSDEAKRAAYDRQRGADTPVGSEFLDDADFPDSASYLQDAWNTALEYFPDLAELESKLSKLSRKLAYVFKAYMLEARPYKNRARVAEAMELDFLQTYFGTNDQIVRFARDLIGSRNRPAAKALNKAISVLGTDIDPDLVIEKIKLKHCVLEEAECVRLLGLRGYKATKSGSGWRIVEPMGGVAKLSSFQELKGYLEQRTKR